MTCLSIYNYVYIDLSIYLSIIYIYIYIHIHTPTQTQTHTTHAVPVLALLPVVSVVLVLPISHSRLGIMEPDRCCGIIYIILNGSVTYLTLAYGIIQMSVHEAPRLALYHNCVVF